MSVKPNQEIPPQKITRESTNSESHVKHHQIKKEYHVKNNLRIKKEFNGE